jgi:amino-acid N-acetyltransferase
MASWNVQQATPRDWPRVAELLEAAGLPLAGAEDHLSDFLLAYRGDALLGVAGLERHGDTALLRSVAVASTARGQALGQALVRQALEQARRAGLKQVVLLTTTAADFFPRFGFRQISRAEVPLAAQASIEFQEACPATAAVMSLVLEPEAD